MTSSLNSLLLFNSLYLNSIKSDNHFDKTLQQHQIEAYINNFKVSVLLIYVAPNENKM